MRHLSIFSSENILALKHLPLRTWLWLAFVTACLAVVTLVSSIGTDRLSTRFKRPMPAYPESGEVMILGDSTLLYLKNWDYPVRDFALPSCGYLTQKSLFDAISPEMPDLRVLLLSLSILDYYKRDVEGRAGDYRDLIDWGVPWHKLPGLTPVERTVAFTRYNRLTAPFFVGPKFDIRTLSRVSVFPLEFNPDESIPKDFEAQQETPVAQEKAATAESTQKAPPLISTPQQPNPILTPSPSAGKSSLTKEESATLTIYARHLLPYVKEATGEPLLHQKQALFEILASCRDHGIQPVFIKVPSPGGLLRSAPITDQRMNDLYAEVSAEFSDLAIPIWDAEKEQGIYGVDLFKDHLHLNDKGLAQLNQFFNEKLAALPLPGSNVPLMDSIRRTGNLLLPNSPADRPSLWVKSAGVKVAAVSVPLSLRKIAHFATRIVLPPGASIYQPTESPVLPGTTCEAHVWIWANRPGPSDGLRIVLARHGDTSSFEGAAVPINQLSNKPEKFSIAAKFVHRHPMMRLDIRNDSTQEQTFFIAGPSIINQYPESAPSETKEK